MCMNLIMIGCFQILFENENIQDKKFKDKESLPQIQGKWTINLYIKSIMNTLDQMQIIRTSNIIDEILLAIFQVFW